MTLGRDQRTRFACFNGRRCRVSLVLLFVVALVFGPSLNLFRWYVTDPATSPSRSQVPEESEDAEKSPVQTTHGKRLLRNRHSSPSPPERSPRLTSHTDATSLPGLQLDGVPRPVFSSGGCFPLRC
jgi:hypothetical protein